MTGRRLCVIDLRCEYRQNPLGIGTARPRLGWKLAPGRRGLRQVAYQLQVACEDPTFASPCWDTGRVESDQSVHIEYDGPSLISRTRYWWRVRVWDQDGNDSGWSEPAWWETGLLDPAGWVAKWITPDPAALDPQSQPAFYLRRPFHVRGPVWRARIYATALGLYELHLNGQRVGDWLFTPGWTSYKHRLQYQTYDVTDLVREGGNALGVVLGDGWYKGRLGWKGDRNLYGDRRAALVQLHLTYTDGREEVVATDGTWRAATGPILLSDIYDGEVYDARLEREGWATYGYDDGDWCGVIVLDHPKDVLVAQENLPTRVIQEIRPVALLRTPAGETVLDMGQNMVGWVEFTVSGAPGDRVVLRHAEVLDRDGNFYTENLRSAKQTIEYICRGGGVERFAPHFTFQGFRYVKIEAYPGEVTLDRFVGKVIHTDLEPTGHFECSEPLVNQLHRNILWGQKGNFVDVPTDCPQRDERLGWTGDAQIFIRTAAFLMNVAPFFTKWLRDLKADQRPDGGVPFVIPDVPIMEEHSSAAWGDAATICPWTLYLCYGDRRVLDEQYESMKAWVEYIRRQGESEFLWNTGFHFGDWLALDAKENSYTGFTPKDLIATAFYAYSTQILAQAAAVLGKHEDAATYRELHARIVEAFNREFVTPAGRLVAGTQTAQVLALMFGLVEGEARRRAAETLVRLIEENGYHLTTGFVGTPYLLHVLTAIGRDDVAARLVLQTTYPSWLYAVLKGATTVWEHWDGIKEDGSFWPAAMNSFNHYAYGAVGDWLYRALAGIDTDPDQPGYKRILIRPRFAPGFRWVRATYRSLYGEIASFWEVEEGQVRVEVTVPPNTTAVIYLPGACSNAVREGAVPLAQAEGVLSVASTSEGVRVEVGAGSYSFTYSR